MMGRYPHFKSTPRIRDYEVVNESMDLIKIKELKERYYNTLSGGEAQKVQMARVLSQIWDEEKEGRILLLDEPVSSLDLLYQHELLRIAKSFIDEKTFVIAVLHDINLALNYADRMVFMKDAGIVYEFDVNEPLEKEVIMNVFDVKADIITNPVNGKPLVIVNE